MPITWDLEMDRKLFLAILKVHNISVDYGAVAAELATAEQPCTPVAIQRRITKIKSQIKAVAIGPSEGGVGRKRGAGKANSESPAKKGKNWKDESDASIAAAATDGEDDEVVSGGESKTKSEREVKTEGDTDEYDL